MEERINAAWDEVVRARKSMELSRWATDDAEETAISDLGDEWTNAKNNDVRRALVREKLAEDLDYHEARNQYRKARAELRVALFEVERLKMLIDSAAVAIKFGV